MARYLGAKFYRGEQYYLQIDSHSEFVQNWEDKWIQMVAQAPAEKPVISTYPPDSTQNWRNTIGFRMCDSEFAAVQIEWQIIRLGSSMAFDHSIPDVPCYAPFVAAGFFFTVADFLYEVPFDPFLPWIFLGEEISMSARLWTADYDIFSPTVNVLNYYCVRRHYPKFWESVNRFFKKPIHNDILELIINRVKSMLRYPESAPQLVFPPSILYRLPDWGMGKKRSLKKYMEMVGLDMFAKKVQPNQWCHKDCILKTVRITPELQNHLKEYIEEFVLCTHCYLPETCYVITSSHQVSPQCASCHSDSPLNVTNKFTSSSYYKLKGKKKALNYKDHPAATASEQLKELKQLPADPCLIYLGAVFTEHPVSQNEVEKHQEMLSALAASEIQQRHLLAAVEWLCGTRYPALLRLFPKLLLQLYDAEVVEEDTFFAWAGDTTRNEFTVDLSLLSFETLESLHAAAAPFIKWLQEAEEEEEEGDEENDEVNRFFLESF